MTKHLCKNFDCPDYADDAQIFCLACRHVHYVTVSRLLGPAAAEFSDPPFLPKPPKIYKGVAWVALPRPGQRPFVISLASYRVARKGKNLVATWQKTDSSDETNLVLMFVSNGKPCMLVLSDMPRTREFPKRDKVKPLASRLPIPKDKTRLEAAIKKLEGRLTGRCIDSQMLPQPQRPRLAKATSASSKRETVLAWYQEKEQRRKIRSVMKKWDTYYGNYVLRGLGLTSAPDLGYTKPKTQEETVTMLVSFEQEKIDYVLALRARRKGERDLRKLQERLEQLTAVTNGQTREE